MHDLMDPQAKTFIQISEVWIPDGDRLVLDSGDYARSGEFGAASRGESFARGEGLPGKAWAEGRPVVLKQLDGSLFKRGEAAAAAGLTSAVAVPVFAGKDLRAVLVILCGGDDTHIGAIEIWAARQGALMLDDGYYGGARDFEWVSQHSSFARGQGLPGGVWATATPILMRDLGSSYAFMRAQHAGRAGLKTGLGLPIPTPNDDVYVLTLLSGSNTPIARRFEIWDARAARVGNSRGAVLVDGICAREGPLWSRQNPPVDAPVAKPWQGPIGQVLGSGLPVVRSGAGGLPADYESMVALPLYRGAELAHVVAWYI